MSGPLRYLFKVVYQDGTVFEQRPDDRSVLEEGRSAFFDATVRVDERNNLAVDAHGTPLRRHDLAAFVLYPQLDDEGPICLVDLMDGHFELNGAPFWLHTGQIGPLRLLFSRRHTHNFNVAVVIGADGDPNMGPPVEQEHRIAYRVGWQGLVDGKLTNTVLELR
jgi:hypothetical protein